MFLEIVTPEASIFQGEVDSVTVPGVVGEFQILNNHAPIVSLLQEGKVRINGNLTIPEAFESQFSNGDNGSKVLKINSGTIEMSDNKIIILVDWSVLLDSIKHPRLFGGDFFCSFFSGLSDLMLIKAVTESFVSVTKE